MATPPLLLDDLAAMVGEELGPSGWRDVEQAAVAAFAGATGEIAWIHLDGERAARGPFGGTIAPGMLTLSLVPALVAELLPVADAGLVLLQRVEGARFPVPVPVGTAVRGWVRPTAVEDVPGGVEATISVRVERDGGIEPVCLADVVLRWYR